MKIDLSLEEVNLVLQALGAQPYAQVFSLVDKIKAQATAQLENKTTEESKED